MRLPIKKKFNDPQYLIMTSGSVSDAPDCTTVCNCVGIAEKVRKRDGATVRGELCPRLSGFGLLGHSAQVLLRLICFFLCVLAIARGFLCSLFSVWRGGRRGRESLIQSEGEIQGSTFYTLPLTNLLRSYRNNVAPKKERGNKCEIFAANVLKIFSTGYNWQVPWPLRPKDGAQTCPYS